MTKKPGQYINFVENIDYKSKYEKLLEEKSVWETFRSQMEIKVANIQVSCFRNILI